MFLKMWYDDWNKLSERDKEEFIRVNNQLLNKTFILRDKYDSREKNLIINKDYRFVERNFSLISDYLFLAGWHLQMDSYLGVIAAYNRFGTNRFHLDKNTTYFLYVLRLIYEEEREKINLAKHVTTTVGEMVEKMFHLGLADKKPADTALRDGLNVLKRFQILDKLEGDWANPETRLVIYPSILLLVSNEKISGIFSTLIEEGDVGEEDTQADAFN